jgi:hypothetical protein
MGYYTDFDLSFQSAGVEKDKEIIDEISDIAGYDLSNLEITGVKWYKWRDDMVALSAQYPSILFKLTGAGEEKRDMWKGYFKGGKAQVVKAVITFESYDESKLV